ncbi:MAG: histidine kinase dimerization/phospho-acceptor domain-containing protein, partial [Syntrophomonadaceae bacterium]|nr:histidine kinase dimerization/phospho-acceptor domain-containing protein [Syntrophomonadaceae bacterium]
MAWVVQTVILLLICSLIMLIYLTWLIIKFRSREKFLSTNLAASNKMHQELVEAREQAQAANMAKNQFLANMSHEIRTPMIGIMGAVDLLAESKLANEQYENIEIIRECGEQLLSIINGILDMSKIELGLMELHPKACSLPDLFAHLVNIVEPMLKEKGLSIKL